MTERETAHFGFGVAEAYNRLSGISVWRELPEGQEPGGYIDIEGERYFTTKREVDRIRYLPTAEEMREKVAAIEKLMRPKQKEEKEGD